MNWTHRRPFRHQFAFGGVMTKAPMASREYRRVPSPKKRVSDQPIDAIRLQLADYGNNRTYPCPVHRPQQVMTHRREHPYITTFSDHRSSIRRTHSSVHSISTIATDFVHQRVSTIHTYPSSASALDRAAVVNDDDELMVDEDVIEHHRQLAALLDGGREQVQVPITVAPPAIVLQEEQLSNEDQLQLIVEAPPLAREESNRVESNKCRSCTMLIDIVEQQAQQIRQYAEQTSQQADLLARLARRVADVEEGVDDGDESVNNLSNSERNNHPVKTT